MSTEEEEALLTRARAGDAEPLLKAWEPRIYRFGLRMCGDEDSAREVLQETLLAAFRGLHQFRGDAALSTWLYSLARSFCIRQRRTRTTDPLGSDEHEDEAPRPDSVAHARELGLVLQAALLSLSDDYREVVVLKDVEGGFIAHAVSSENDSAPCSNPVDPHRHVPSWSKRSPRSLVERSISPRVSRSRRISRDVRSAARRVMR